MIGGWVVVQSFLRRAVGLAFTFSILSKSYSLLIFLIFYRVLSSFIVESTGNSSVFCR